MLRSYELITVLAGTLVIAMAGCDKVDQAPSHQESANGIGGSSGMSSQAGNATVADDLPGSDPSGTGNIAPGGRSPMQSSGSSAAMGSAGHGPSVDASLAPAPSMPSGSSSNAMDAGQPDSSPDPRNVVRDLSDKALATWGSSVCDGFGVPSRTGWPWTLERKLAEIKGPKVLHASTSGHSTDSKESSLERGKIESADFVVVCLSLGNQGLGSAASDSSAQAVVDSYLDDIFTDDSDGDRDPVSMVKYIKSLGAYPIVTLVYPMADYNNVHCKHLVEANILQQGFGIATINHLGPTNAGNNYDQGDCNWANGRNAPINVQSDARHPNQLGHDEAFYAFPPDLPFALASEIPFPVRSQATDYLALSSNAGMEPIRYTPEHAMHNYTMQFTFQAASDGTLAAIDLGMMGFLTIEVSGGTIRLLTDDGMDALQGSEQVTNNDWHDVAATYSHVRQKLALYLDGALVGEHDTREGSNVRELFPQAFILGGPAASGRQAAPVALQLRDLFINRTSLHAMEVKERATTAWVGAGSLDVYAPLRVTAPTENRAQTLQVINVQL